MLGERQVQREASAERGKCRERQVQREASAERGKCRERQVLPLSVHY